MAAAASLRLQSALDVSPTSSFPRHSRAMVGFLCGEWEQAVADLTAYIDSNPSDTDAHSKRAHALGKLGRGAEAAVDAARAAVLAIP